METRASDGSPSVNDRNQGIVAMLDQSGFVDDFSVSVSSNRMLSVKGGVRRLLRTKRVDFTATDDGGRVAVNFLTKGPGYWVTYHSEAGLLVGGFALLCAALLFGCSIVFSVRAFTMVSSPENMEVKNILYHLHDWLFYGSRMLGQLGLFIGGLSLVAMLLGWLYDRRFHRGVVTHYWRVRMLGDPNTGPLTEQEFAHALVTLLAAYDDMAY